MTKPTKWSVRPVKTQIWSEYSLSSWRTIGVLSYQKADAQTDLSLRWADRSFCWSCHAVIILIYHYQKWAATWQNQQNGCAPSEDSDQPGHLPSLIRVFAVRMKKAWDLSNPLSAQRRLWSDWVDAQADLSLLWAHTHFVGFVMSWLKCFNANELLSLFKGKW